MFLVQHLNNVSQNSHLVTAINTRTLRAFDDRRTLNESWKGNHVDQITEIVYFFKAFVIRGHLHAVSL